MRQEQVVACVATQTPGGQTIDSQHPAPSNECELRHSRRASEDPLAHVDGSEEVCGSVGNRSWGPDGLPLMAWALGCPGKPQGGLGMAKWTMLDRQRTVTGVLDRVSQSSGLFEDRDTNYWVTPDDKSVLRNNQGATNRSGQIVCEIQAGLFFRGLFVTWSRTLEGAAVTASGVLVQDDNHEHWTELHPVDLIAGRVTSSLLEGADWIANRAADRGLQIGSSLLAYRFVAASDTRKSLFFEGPPLGRTKRQSVIWVPLPARPGPTWTPFVGRRTLIVENADVKVMLDPAGQAPRMRIEVTCNTADDGGPGVVMGEAVAYWKDSRVPELSLEPRELSFGQLIPMKSTTSDITIRNTGAAPLVINVDASGATAVFSWPALVNVTIPVGGTRGVPITFRPRKAGPASTTWRVRTNDALGPKTVALSGTGRDVIPQ